MRWVVGVEALGDQGAAVGGPVVGDSGWLGAVRVCVCGVVWCAGADWVASEDCGSEALLVGGAVPPLPGGAPLPVCLGPMGGASALAGGYWLGASGGGAGVHGTGHAGLPVSPLRQW